MLHEIAPLDCHRVNGPNGDFSKDKIHCEHTFLYLLDTFTIITDSPMYSYEKERCCYQICTDHNCCFAKETFN